jgi:DNA-binding response OmpR family regulator
VAQRVLIIDDEEHLRGMMRLTLETAGYEVGEAADGDAGLKQFGDGSKWDAVLLDQKMPGLDGLETLRRIRGRDREARVVMVTAFASVELAVDAMKIGASDFVRKPMTPETLRNALTAALEKPRAGRPASVSEDEDGATPLVTTLTLNGFRFWPADGEQARPANPYERRYTVRDQSGRETEVVVEIDEEAVGYVERMIRRRLPPESSFWTSQAERFLGDFLWNESRLPPNARLTLKGIDRDDLPAAERWKDD